MPRLGAFSVLKFSWSFMETIRDYSLFSCSAITIYHILQQNTDHRYLETSNYFYKNEKYTIYRYININKPLFRLP